MLSWLVGFAVVSQQSTVPVNPWEKEAFYQVFPRSYRDSNGDGIGDFKGIEEGLPSIQKLGCTAILINPVQKARVYHNYFADDWMDVDPSYGTLAEFKHLTETAHKMGIKVVLDMEQQYAASGHPWYVAAAKNPKGPDADLFAKPFKPDPNAPSPWYDGAKVQFATLNMNHPRVLKELRKVFRFWSGVGVNGYRLDHMMDELDWAGQSKGLYAKVWTPIENEIKRLHPGTFFVGEQADWDSFRSPVEMFAGTPTDACFNFRMRNALLGFRKGQISKSLEEYGYFTKPGRMQLNFIENHDMNRFASEEPNLDKQKLAAALMVFAKGAPILYYGQEIGMKGEQGHFGSDGNDIPVRLAYRWNRKLESPGTALWYKNTGPWWNKRYSRDDDGISVEEQDTDPKSLLNWYRRILAIRQGKSALKTGNQELVDTKVESVLGFRRTLGAESMLILANLSEQVVSVPGEGFGKRDDLISGEAFSAGAPVKLGPWQVVAIRESL